jgi:CBS domain-containing protein
MLVSEIMVKDVVTLRPKDTLRDVAVRFADHNISGAPVVDDEGHVVGIVSEADIFETIKRRSKELKMVYLSPGLSMVGLSFKESPSDKKTEDIIMEIGDIRVSQMMVRNVITVTPEDNIKAAIDLISSGRINRVPVVKNGKLVGIVTRGDIIKGISGLV